MAKFIEFVEFPLSKVCQFEATLIVKYAPSMLFISNEHLMAHSK